MKRRKTKRIALAMVCLCLAVVFSSDLFFRTPVVHAQISLGAMAERRDFVTGQDEPWKIEAQRISYDQKSGVYVAEGEVLITSADRSIQADWARLDSVKKEAELSGNVQIRYAQDWLKGERAIWNLETETGSLDGGTVYFSRNHFYVQGRRIAKTGESEYELDEGLVTSCDPFLPDWSIRYKHMKVDTDGIGYATHPSFWVRRVPLLYSPFLAFPANTERKSGFLLPIGGYSELNGFDLEIPYYWAIRPDMDATFYGHYLQERGFMVGLEYRIAHDEWGEGIWLFNYLQDQVDIEHLQSEGFTFETRERYWLRSRHNFDLPEQIEGRLDLDLLSDRNYLKEFEKGSTAWDFTNRMFTQYFGRGLINDKTIETRESILYMNQRRESSNLGMDVHYWQNLDTSQNELTLQQLPKVFFDVAPSFVGDTRLYYSLGSSWVDYFREEQSRGQRVDVHPRLHYPMRPLPYLEVEPSAGVRATSYYVDWNDDPNEDGKSAWQGRVVPDMRMELSTMVSRAYHLPYDHLKAVQHTIRPEVTYEYIPDIDQKDLPFWDQLDHIREIHDVRYGFSTYLTSKWLGKDPTGNPSTTYGEAARLRITQAYNIKKGSAVDANDLLFDRLFLDNDEEPTGDGDDRQFSDVSVELNLTPGRYVTLTYDASFSPEDGGETGKDLFVTLDSMRGHSLIVDYRTREDPDVNELITQLRVKPFPNITLTSYHDYSLDQEELFKQVYGITYQRGCWALTLAYREEGDDKEITLSVNLFGIGQFGGGYSPITGGLRME